MIPEGYPPILEKSATASVASRMRLSRRRRLARTCGSSALTRTLSKKASTGARSFRQRRHGGGEILDFDGGSCLAFGGADRLEQGLLRGLGENVRVNIAGVGFTRFLLLVAEDVGGALVAGEQRLAVVGVEEFAQGFDAADDEQEVVLVAEGEDRIDQIVAGALLAELDLQAVGEEGEQAGYTERGGDLVHGFAGSFGMGGFLDPTVDGRGYQFVSLSEERRDRTCERLPQVDANLIRQHNADDPQRRPP